MAQAKGEVMHLAELKQKSIADLNDVAAGAENRRGRQFEKAGIDFCDPPGADREKRRGLWRRCAGNAS